MDRGFEIWTVGAVFAVERWLATHVFLVSEAVGMMVVPLHVERVSSGHGCS